MADEAALDMINKDTHNFMTQMTTDIVNISGLRWDDLIIRLEWKQEEKLIQQDLKTDFTPD